MINLVKVFISYSWDSEEHKEQVLALADRLNDEGGIDCTIDQYVQAPPEGWARWMRQQVEENSDFVLAVYTETYQRRLEGREKQGLGLGVTWEGNIITDNLYKNGTRNEKFIPIVFSEGDKPYISSIFGSVSCYNVGDDKGYEELYFRLTQQHDTPKPEPNPNVKVRPPRERKLKK